MVELRWRPVTDDDKGARVLVADNISRAVAERMRTSR